MEQFIESLKELLNDTSLSTEQRENIINIIRSYKNYQQNLISEINEILNEL